MPVHRRITALLAALTTLAGGSFVSAAAADADSESSERGARPTLNAAPPQHATARVAHARSQVAHADRLAGALGVSDERLGVVLRELRIERRATDLVGARPAIRTPEQLAEERARYAAALAEKVGVAPDVAAAALDGTRSPGATGP